MNKNITKCNVCRNCFGWEASGSLNGSVGDSGVCVYALLSANGVDVVGAIPGQVSMGYAHPSIHMIMNEQRDKDRITLGWGCCRGRSQPDLEDDSQRCRPGLAQNLNDLL